MPDNFWLSDGQWAAIAAHLPMVHTGPVRQDDRRIISGIVHRLREGCRWRALPAEYGPYTTVFNRYNRWSKRGLWQDIFAALAGCAEPPGVAMIDSTAVRAHRAASGAKGGNAAKPSAARAADARPKSTRSSTKPAGRSPSA
jgi:transposase